MKYALILLLLAGCDVVVTPARYDVATELCKPHGGLEFLTVELAGQEHRQVKAFCVDKTEVQKVVPK